MIRGVQISILFVALVVARHVFFHWLKQPDTLPQLLREAFEAVFGYFVYVTVGLLVFSRVAGYGFGGAGNVLIGFVIVIGAALYVGVGVWGLWRYLREQDQRPRSPRD